MDVEAIQSHWTDWASRYGGDVRATTRCRSAKLLEVDALRRRIAALIGEGRDLRLLEVGCGNGINCIELARSFPTLRIDGIDFVAEMVEAARAGSRDAELGDRLRFVIGDVSRLDAVEGLEPAYDAVFTDRCLINLTSAEEQAVAIAALAARLAPAGHLLMIENCLDTFETQNRARLALGLNGRTPAAFNRFFTDAEMSAHVAAAGLDLVEVEDFASLHDLLLYVLLPAANGGTIEYDHPIVCAAAELSMALAAGSRPRLGAFGQNRLYVCRHAST